MLLLLLSSWRDVRYPLWVGEDMNRESAYMVCFLLDSSREERKAAEVAKSKGE